MAGMSRPAGGSGVDAEAVARAVDATMDGVAVLRDGEYVYVNQAHAAIYGYDEPAGMLGRHWRGMYDEAELDRFDEEILPRLQETGSWRGEAVGRRRDGERFAQELSLSFVTDEDLVCVVRDVSDRADRERQLRERTEQLRTLADDLPVITFALDPEGTFVESRGRGLSAIGIEAGDHVGQSVFDVYEGNPAVLEAARRALEGETGEATLEIGDRDFEVSYQPVTGEDGTLQRVVGVAHDVTERRRRVRRLRALHRASRQLTEDRSAEEVAASTVSIAEAVLDHHRAVVWERVGAPPAEGDDGPAESSTVTLRAAAATPDAERAVDGAVPDRGPESAEAVLFAAGEPRFTADATAELSGQALPGMTGRLLTAPVGDRFLLAVGSESPGTVSQTERYLVDILARNAESAMERARREAALAERTEQLEFLNGLLRHDVLNGMLVVRSRADHLAETLDGDAAGHAETISRWAEDSVDLVERVRHVLDVLADEGGWEAEPVRVRPALEEEVERLARTHEAATLTVEAPEDLVVAADTMFAEVVGNLVGNAVEHAGTAPTVRVSARATDGDRVEVRVEDDGDGVDPAVAGSVFERGVGGIEADADGGFGLYFVAVLVDAWDGEVWVEDSDLGGAAFVLSLPAAAAEEVPRDAG